MVNSPGRSRSTWNFCPYARHSRNSPMREITVASATPWMPMGATPGIHPKMKVAFKTTLMSSAEEFIRVLIFALSTLFKMLK